ncbi:matrixin family metalloprotease [Arthrobacter sp. H14]|uniref:matrixin family metalloprotease n=1 Tax=Arthrobacter sp. H14 TaxID=1312959 RepID=UPI000686DAAB|nr:matrixin family metalloprotease [Arthrobacter sp. H14]
MSEGPLQPPDRLHGRRSSGAADDQPRADTENGSDDGEAPIPFDGVRRSPSGRIPQWALDEAVGVEPEPPGPWSDFPHQHPRGPRGPSFGYNPTTGTGNRGRYGSTKSGRNLPPSYGYGYQQPARPRRRFRGLMVMLTVAALTIGAWFYSGQSLMPQAGFGTAPQDPGAASGTLDTFDSDGTTFQVDPPSPGYELQEEPLGTPAPLDVQSDSYSFMNPGRGSQGYVAYDPCRPLHYVIRDENMPDDGERMITEAIASVSAATGLQFVYDGLTEEDPLERRDLVQEDLYGDRWAPMLIAWVTPEEEPEVAGGTIGLGGSSFVSSSGSPTAYVSGAMMLDAPQIEDLAGFPGGYEQARAIVMHELGHVVGLDHVNDPSQLMYAESNLEVTSFGAGDLTGLAKLGQGICVPQL